ncbi:MAG TPA: TonB-dependent receptor [Vicinamibacterales bacterium]|jgi:carboxypeptidase family protein|nr:TonB-dependent receptor [Vicinamibacterales bacterium]
MKKPQLAFLLLMSLCASPVTAAQQETATITGSVKDQSGAIVPKATVTVTNTQTNISVKTEADDTGFYIVPSLRPGEYSVTVESAGFSKVVRSGVTLQVAQVARIDLTLQPGQLTESVEVVAATPLLDTQTSSRGLVIDEKKIVELPLNGRDYNQLALLSPGVLPGTPRLASVNFKGVLNVNGNRTFNNVFLLDGVDNISYSNSFRGENVQLVQPSIEALQEFKIQTNAYSAEYGRSSGAVVNATIKSGTNIVRGSVYDFFRNDALDANNFFSNALNAPKPKRERNQFGGAVGGPLVKNKTFWFGDYEGLRDLEGVPRVRQVPTAAEKAGLFSSAVVDPFAAGRPEFARNAQGQWVIPKERWDPVGAAIVALIPDPNAGSTIYASTPVTDTRQDQFDVRLDHQYSTNLTLFGRFSFVDTLTFRPAPLLGLGEGSFNDAFGSNDNRSQGLALGLTWTASPTLVGEFRFGYARGDYYTYPPNFGIDGAAQIGLKNVPNDPAIVGGVPKVNIQGFDAVGRHTSTPQFQTPRSWNPRATFSLTRGAHFIKFGGEFLHVQTRINDLNATIGRMNFENRFTNRAMGDLLLGLPSQLALTSYTVMDQGQDMRFFFVQDDYRLSPKLTANVGLRYEYANPPVEKDNQFSNFDPIAGTMIFAKDGSTYERALIHPDRNNVAPRIGFAYTPWSRAVVRGGYGIFYNHTVRQGREGLLGFNPPYLVDNLLQTGVTGAAAVASAAPFRLVEGYPSGLLDPNSLAATVARRAQDPNQRTPYIQQYNFGVQYELMQDVVLDIAYVGNKGTKLNGFRNLNQRAVITNPDGSQSAGARPYPAFGDIQWMENRVSSTYNSLQARLEKRFSHGLSGMVSYTLGQALTGGVDHISTSGGGAGFDTGVFREPQDAYNLRAERGPSEFDVRHRLVVNYIWEMPFGRDRRYGKDWSPALDFVLGGWQLTGIHAVQSGLALTATLGGSTVLNLGGERRARPNLVGNPELPENQRTVARWFNTDAFAAFSPSPQAFGNAGIGIMRGPGMANFDFTLAKNFRVGDRRSFQFRTEFFNAFNHANFGPPNIMRDSSGFGQILTAANARIIQFGLKFYF